jgi:large repetitive protein
VGKASHRARELLHRWFGLGSLPVLQRHRSQQHRLRQPSRHRRHSQLQFPSSRFLLRVSTPQVNQPASVSVGGTGTVSATASSGLAVTFSSTMTSICTISGRTVKGVAAGTCTIAANQAGNSNYYPAPQVTQTITVLKKNQTITFGAAPTLSVGKTGTVSATASSGLAVTFSSMTISICTISGRTVKGVAAGTCTIAANQLGNSSYNPAAQVKQGIKVGKGSQTIKITAPSSITRPATGSVTATASSGLPVTLTSITPTICRISGSTVTGVAAGTCSIAANQAGNANYNPAPQVTRNIAVK